MRLLDLFCGAGGAAMGYYRAGFTEIVGVDIRPQPRYPFTFVEADAMTYPLEGFDAIHASPPCQKHSTIAKQQRVLRPDKYDHPDLVDATRKRLEAADVPWVIENVEGAPLYRSLRLCGSSFGLDLRRHRTFECGGWTAPLAPQCAHHWQKPRFRSLDQRRQKLTTVVSVHGGGQHGKNALATVIGVHGSLNYSGELELRKRAMGIDWMVNYELVEAIPPAYTEYIGRFLLAQIDPIPNDHRDQTQATPTRNTHVTSSP